VLTRFGMSGQAGPDTPADDVERADGGWHPSDADVVRASVRDPSRFGEIFDRYADDILRYAGARLGADLAEDVTAETFLAAFRARGGYDLSRANARPWLYGIAIRQIGKHRRAERRYLHAMTRVHAETVTETVTADFGDRVADRVTAEQLRPRLSAVLAGLTRQDRELLLLVAWTDLTYEESAQALGVSVSAVKSRLHRIRVRTRQALGETNPALPSEDIGPEKETHRG